MSPNPQILFSRKKNQIQVIHGKYFSSKKIYLQLRKLDKERLSFICEKKNVSIKRERLIEALKKEKVQLQERLNAISVGPHAQRELKVRIPTQQKLPYLDIETFLCVFVEFYLPKTRNRFNF